MKVRRRPPEFDAEQYVSGKALPFNKDEVLKVKDAEARPENKGKHHMFNEAMDRWIPVHNTDWILKDENGAFSIVHDSDFKKQFIEV
jgi:hypothetical protein